MSNTDFFDQFEGAIFDGDIEVIKKIVSEGGDINEVSDNDQNPRTLLSLAEEYAPGIVEEMVQLGADVNKTLDYLTLFYGNEALHVAINRRWELSARLLTEATTKEDVDRLNEPLRNTPLISATQAVTKAPEFGLNIMKLLLEKGADPSMKNANGDSAIDKAKSHIEFERWTPEIGKEVLDLFSASS